MRTTRERGRVQRDLALLSCPGDHLHGGRALRWRLTVHGTLRPLPPRNVTFAAMCSVSRNDGVFTRVVMTNNCGELSARCVQRASRAKAIHRSTSMWTDVLMSAYPLTTSGDHSKSRSSSPHMFRGHRAAEEAPTVVHSLMRTIPSDAMARATLYPILPSGSPASRVRLVYPR